MTRKQIAALKYLICEYNKKNSKTVLAQKVLWFLISQSRVLTRSVCVTLTEEVGGFTAKEVRDIAFGIDNMLSSNGATHLHELLDLMGSPLDFKLHYGDFNPNRTGDPFSTAGQFEGHSVDKVRLPEQVEKGHPLRYTFWLAKKEHYSQNATLVEVTKEKLETINLEKPGLYKTLEPK